jgi:hypothetical protein
MSGRTHSNPFCTRFFQPGSIPFFFPPPASLDALVEKILGEARHRLAIVGPHGSGKSTLLAHLLRNPALAAPACSTRHLLFQSRETHRHRWHASHRALQAFPPGHRRLLAVDGWEQLDPILQWYIRVRAGTRRIAILATAHTLPRGFREIWRTHVDATVEQHVLCHMLKDAPELGSTTVTHSEAWHRSRQCHGQNLRESLFDMYDWYRDQVDAPSASG